MPATTRGTPSFRYDEETDWFGNPVKGHRAPPVECPLCHLWFDDPARYRSHLDQEHGLGETTAREPAVRRRRLSWLALIPAPTLTLATGLILYWALIVAVLPKPLAIAGIWIGVVVFGVPAQPRPGHPPALVTGTEDGPEHRVIG